MGSTDERVRWWRRLFGRKSIAELDPTRADLVVVASGFDDAEACSAVLDRAAAREPLWVPEAQAVLRHHLRLPSSNVAEAVAIAAQDGYAEGEGGTEQVVDSEPRALVDDARPLILQRVQILDALHCSQERSRMAGLAQRLDGTVLGWDALQPARDDSAAVAG